MQPKPTFHDLITQGYGVQLPLPLPEVPGVRSNRTTECPKCHLTHADAVDDIACTHGYQATHPT